MGEFYRPLLLPTNGSHALAPSGFSLVPKATLMDQIYSHDVIESVTKQRRDSCTRKHTNLLT
ncbi:uncharacterized protein PHALS_05807 [Plasmopara halstedii]|uniref:Uncharacterized protein n=1 Tax=Plasmopara halstedii TaxID=4781 RepID=A0A0P1AA61_PLAHL|nr:uncharacterized protein PHALS_05807 [Plasmopara halstedii]CEG37752.1 hypothetical protein PHALS_05807 [Plasmopara halstedii]|eukprot:XP_024574121.1 hypothetical protein PHALS_05807 [Plasmopara halstedii]